MNVKKNYHHLPCKNRNFSFFSLLSCREAMSVIPLWPKWRTSKLCIIGGRFSSNPSSLNQEIKWEYNIMVFLGKRGMLAFPTWRHSYEKLVQMTAVSLEQVSQKLHLNAEKKSGKKWSMLLVGGRNTAYTGTSFLDRDHRNRTNTKSTRLFT